MKKLFLGLLILNLSGCVAFSTPLTSPISGRTVTCSDIGWGIGGSILAKISYDKCLERAKEKGYMAND